MRIKPNYIILPLATVAVATIGGYLTASGLDWYYGLELPALAPGGGFIGTVWTVIYILTTLSALIFWNAPRRQHFDAIVVLFAANAIFNALWSLVFFVSHDFIAAMVEMTILNLINLALIRLLWNYERKSAWLLVPYLIWVAFATYLTYAISALN